MESFTPTAWDDFMVWWVQWDAEIFALVVVVPPFIMLARWLHRRHPKWYRHE